MNEAKRHAIAAGHVFDGWTRHKDAAVIVEGSLIVGVTPQSELPLGLEVRKLPSGVWLVPGFIDLQVNGGGDVLFNNSPTPEAILAIAAAHRKFGTTALLPTFITDTSEKMKAAFASVESLAESEPGILGIHLEGPFLSSEKPGVHDASLMRQPGPADLEMLCGPRKGALLVTLAPERVPRGFIAQLAKHGVRVLARPFDGNICGDSCSDGRRAQRLYSSVQCHEASGQPGARPYSRSSRVTQCLVRDHRRRIPRQSCNASPVTARPEPTNSCNGCNAARWRSSVEIRSLRRGNSDCWGTLREVRRHLGWLGPPHGRGGSQLRTRASGAAGRCPPLRFAKSRRIYRPWPSSGRPAPRISRRRCCAGCWHSRSAGDMGCREGISSLITHFCRCHPNPNRDPPTASKKPEIAAQAGFTVICGSLGLDF